MRRSAPGFPDAVAALSASPFWVRLEGGDLTGSTNEDCRGLAEAGAPEGTAVVALQQAAGRGRLGRAWESPLGGVYLSALLRPSLAPADAGPLPLVVGLGVVRGLGSIGVRIGLKWPNDVVALGDDGRAAGKLGGILLESTVEGDRLGWVVAGVGVNVARPACEAVPGAAYLEEASGRRPEPAGVAAAVLDGIASAYLDFTSAGFEPMLSEYEGRSVLSGAEVSVSSAAGERIAEGTVLGVDPSGRLVVGTQTGDVAVSAGDVTLRRPV